MTPGYIKAEAPGAVSNLLEDEYRHGSGSAGEPHRLTRRSTNQVEETINANPIVSVSGRGRKWHRDRSCKWLERGQVGADKNLGHRRLVSKMDLDEALQQKPYLTPCKHCAGGH